MGKWAVIVVLILANVAGIAMACVAWSHNPQGEYGEEYPDVVALFPVYFFWATVIFVLALPVLLILKRLDNNK